MALPCAVRAKPSEDTTSGLSYQKTLAKSVSLYGKGLFTAEEAHLILHPAALGSGRTFIRSDLPGKPTLTATIESVVDTPRCTIIGNDRFTIHTVEHLLAALAALEIDNVLIELSGPEVPIFDGSSLPFVEAIDKAGTIEQEDRKETIRAKSPISWSRGDVHLVALPSPDFRVSYTLHFPQSKFLGSQYISTKVTPEIFSREIAPCRTFCLYEEITPFIESGLIKGGDPNNAVIIKEEKVINPDGVRFDDEMARHKVLDLIGDLSLLGHPIRAHIIAIRSGHASNIAFVKKFNHAIREEGA